MQDYYSIYLKTVDFCKHLIPRTPKEIGVVSLATITSIFYSTRISLALGVGYIGLKCWTWTFSEPKPSITSDEDKRPLSSEHNSPITNTDQRQWMMPYTEVAKTEILMPNGELFGPYFISMTQGDTRKQPRPFRFFDILTSCYKPLGYWGTGNAFTQRCWTLPSESILNWVVAENDKIAGNRRLQQSPEEIETNRRSKYFYNETYLKKLLELNFDILNQYKNQRGFAVYKIFCKNVFDESGHVKEDGIDFFIRNHWDVGIWHIGSSYPEHKLLLALIHAAFGDETISSPEYSQLIKIPDEPGLRDVIALYHQFPDHRWRTVQALLRSYDDVDVVRGLLQKLAPGNLYYVGEDNQIVPSDDSCNTLPIYLRNAEFMNYKANPPPPVFEYLICGRGTSEDPYRLEMFKED